MANGDPYTWRSINIDRIGVYDESARYGESLSIPYDEIYGESPLRRQYISVPHRESKSFHGIITLDEDAFLELLGITCGGVRLRGFRINTANNTIEIGLSSDESFIPTHDTMGYPLFKVAEGAEYPRTREVEEGER